VRLVELTEPNRYVAADDDRTPASLDDDHLHAACVWCIGRSSEKGCRHQLGLVSGSLPSSLPLAAEILVDLAALPVNPEESADPEQ
jgi:hypothetical protein